MVKTIKNQLLVFILVIVNVSSFGQLARRVDFVVEGITMDAGNLKPLPYANVINLRTKAGITSNASGGFSISIMPGDTLEFSSVGYQKQKQRFLPEIGEEKKLVFVYLKTRSYNLNEVNVEGELDLIPKSLESDVFKEDPNVKDAVLSPVSFLYYKLNKTERRKRELRDELDAERDMTRVLAVYNRDLIAEFSGFEGTELEQCIIYCNTNINLSPLDNEESIKMKLLDVLSAYFNTLKTPESN